MAVVPLVPTDSDRPEARTHRTIWTLTRTHRRPEPVGWGPKDRWFKSSRPDLDVIPMACRTNPGATELEAAAKEDAS